jgi:hypothetical protein
MRIGVTFFLRKGDDSVWNNGGAQHCAFLVFALRAAFGKENVIAVNAGDGVSSPSSMLSKVGIECEPISDALVDSLDVLVEMAGQVSAEHVERVHARGGRAVGFKFGNAYVIDGERAIHGKPAGAIFNGARFDAIWTNAQHVATCRSYWETCYRAPVRVVPHIWSRAFLDRSLTELPEGVAFGYVHRPGPQRVAVMEPNVNIVKMAHIPMLICERVHRQSPGSLSEVYVSNALHLKESETFRSFAGNLDIVRDKVASFEGRFCAPWFLARFTDIVVAHQWENGLNFAYYDALAGGYPLIHNSDLLPRGVGHYYPGFDADQGAYALHNALAVHGNRALHEAYVDRARDFLSTVEATSGHNVEAHRAAVHALFAAP